MRSSSERLTVKADIAAKFYRMQTDVVKCTTSEELVTVVQEAYDNLGIMGLESTGEFLFPDRSAHLVVATDLLIRRVKLPSIMGVELLSHAPHDDRLSNR